ncbi:MAG TPA: hypothetical protein VFV05_23790 [Methylomirabilota bacterium]|nr:hypothetical protein [Methylomirabilota bacterium]
MDGAPADEGGSRLAQGAEDADALLYYAVSTGRDVGPTVRDPIVRTHRAVSAGKPVTDDEETEFLAAYARLAAMVKPTTAATLRATSRTVRRPWLWRRFSHEPISEAQRVAYRFGSLALILILVIGGAEWTRTFINAVVTDQAEHGRVLEELRTTRAAQKRLAEQIALLDRERQGGAESLRAGLVRQREETDVRVQSLDDREAGLSRRIQAGYETLERILPFVHWDELRNVITPVATIMAVLVLPVLYGALGTCAFVLRTVYAEMVERSFDGRRTGEFMVRIFLGMLSGVSLQWLLVRDGQPIPGGVTPAVLAFLGGYGVELLFAAIDRILSTVITALRGERRGPKPSAERKEGAS